MIYVGLHDHIKKLILLEKLNKTAQKTFEIVILFLT